MLATKKALMDNGLRNVLRRVPNDSVLYLPGLDYGNWHTGTVKDYSGLGNDGAITGATTKVLPSGLAYLDYAPTNQFVNCGNDSSLNHTTGNFAFIMWVNLTSVATTPSLFTRGVHLADGYLCFVDTNKALFFISEQSGAAQSTQSANNTMSLATWQRVVFSRSGTTVTQIVNDAEVSYAAQPAITDPLTSARDFYIGILDDETSSDINGGIALFRGLNTTVSVAQAAAGYNEERHLFEV